MISREQLRSLAQANIAAVAASPDGRALELQAPLGFDLPLGGYVRLGDGDDAFLGLVLERHLELHEGISIDLRPDDLEQMTGTRMPEMQIRPRVRLLQGTGEILGRIGPDGFEPGSAPASGEWPLQPASERDVQSYAAWAEKQGSLAVGRALRGPDSAGLTLSERGFWRHSFVCGQSGSGKSYALGVIVERALLAGAMRIVVLDPNGDLVGLRRLREPPPTDPAVTEALRERAAQTHILRPSLHADGATGRLAIHPPDVPPTLAASLLRLDPVADSDDWSSLVARLAGGIDRLPDHLRRRAENLGVLAWGCWGVDDEPSAIDLAASDALCTVLDLGGADTEIESHVVAASLLDRLWRERARRVRTMIVIDEAHNVCPAVPKDAAQAYSLALCERIANEGRKYGLHLVLVTQRPARIHEAVLSQCDNLVLMRVNGVEDLRHLAATLSHVPSSLILEATNLTLGEALVAGPVVRHPVLLRFGSRLTPDGGADAPAT